jgi:hypothetical protein
VIERFRDSDGLIQHGENLAHRMDAIIATGSVSGELLGEPSAELGARIRAGPGAALHAVVEDVAGWVSRTLRAPNIPAHSRIRAAHIGAWRASSPLITARQT